MAEITAVRIVEGRIVEWTFADGSIRVVDLTPFLRGPAFADIARDDEVFAQVAVDQELGTTSWPNGVDLDPDVLHGDFEPAEPSEQLPN